MSSNVRGTGPKSNSKINKNKNKLGEGLSVKEAREAIKKLRELEELEEQMESDVYKQRKEAIDDLIKKYQRPKRGQLSKDKPLKKKGITRDKSRPAHLGNIVEQEVARGGKINRYARGGKAYTYAGGSRKTIC